MENETIVKYTGRVATLLKKARALHPGTALSGPIALPRGANEGRRVVTVQVAHNAIRSILSYPMYTYWTFDN